jgi:hypothetical protein
MKTKKSKRVRGKGLGPQRSRFEKLACHIV